MAKRRQRSGARRRRGKTADAADAALPGEALVAAPAVEHLVFPGIGKPSANAVLALYFQLQQSEWWDATALAQAQDRQLQALVAAAANTPHYAPLLGALGYVPGAPFDLGRWSALPLLDRRTLQSRGEALRNPGLPREFGGTTVARTSGSSGMPVEVHWPQVLRFYRQAVSLREHVWHRRRFDERFAYLRVFKDFPAASRLPGARAAGWEAMKDVLITGGESFALDLHVDLDDQLAWLARVDPHYLATYPSNLKALLGRALARGEVPKLPALRQVRTLSECVDDELRALVEEVLGVPLVDEYSAQEVGTIALQCPDGPGYHVVSECVRVEVLDDGGRACAPGETGRVVVTPLHNLAMPLLRYDIGDFAEVGDACPCGRGLPVLNRIAGRSRNMLRYPDGRRRWPLPGDGRYREIAPVEQYQLVQTALDRIEVNLVVERPLTDAEADAFCAWVRERLDYPFEVTLAFHASIPRHASGKFEDVRCELPD